VGGHCIGVDPYYLLHKSRQLGYDPQVILSGRRINDGMPAHIAKRLVQLMIEKGNNPRHCKVLVLGITFKENVSDIRNSKVADVVNEFKDFGVQVDIIDPHASSEELHHEYGFGLKSSPEGKYHAVVVAVNHNDYVGLPESYFQNLLIEKGILADIKGVYKGRISNLQYWSL
jgi:UDP-N-acetyl-D-galactosamine dehydrogenase